MQGAPEQEERLEALKELFAECRSPLLLRACSACVTQRSVAARRALRHMFRGAQPARHALRRECQARVYTCAGGGSSAWSQPSAPPGDSVCRSASHSADSESP
mmetsp:Transcript_9724/g.24882  ORF Transcript_9724/g.24882 Transcript_9724/m.24882 type:complete len:103 (+) Transcript_9724:17-325(+)